MTGHGRGAAWVTATVLCLGLVPAAGAQPPSVEATVEPSLVTLGERVRLTVTVTHAPGATVTWPDAPALGPFELVDVRTAPPDTVDGRAVSRAELDLTVFELGTLTVPAIEIALTDAEGAARTVTSDPVEIQVESVGRDDSGDIRDIRAPLSVPFDIVTLAPWLLAAGVVLAAAVWLWRRLRRRAPRVVPGPPPAPPRPAHEVAYEQLAALEASGRLARGEIKAFHIEGSDILRVYLAARFDVDAPELTTDETVEGLRRRSVDPEICEEIRRLLERCDLVKFAKFEPTTDVSADLVPRVRRLVERTARATRLESATPADVPGDVQVA